MATTSDDHLVHIVELEERADALGDGAVKIAILEEAVRIADLHHDTKTAYAARQKLVRAGTFGGRPDIALVAFSWCVAQADRDPKTYDETELLWQYKWVAGGISNFPNITREQIDALFADMSMRYERHGSTMHAVYQIRREVAVDMFDRTIAETAYTRCEQLKRDDLSNCKACVLDSLIDYHEFLGDDTTAVEVAKPIVDGKMSCSKIPQRSYAKVLLPYLRLGKPDRGLKYYKVGYRMIRTSEDFVVTKAQYITFLALTGNLMRAERLFQRHFPEAIRAATPRWRFEFFLAARLFITQLLAVKGAALLTVPPELRAGGEMLQPATSVAEWLDGQLNELATAFDTRNGNDGCKRQIANFKSLGKYAVNCPVDA